MIAQLAQFTDITAALAVGGLSLQRQATELRSAPDIVVATPGRVLDHAMNTMAFGLDSLAVLVLDEADRLLELGFQAEARRNRIPAQHFSDMRDQCLALACMLACGQAATVATLGLAYRCQRPA